MASYPSSIYSPRDKENKSGVVYDAAKKTVIFVEDVSKLDDEVVAIETELGTNPKGIYATVKAWLEALTSAIAGKADDPHGNEAHDPAMIPKNILPTKGDLAVAVGPIRHFKMNDNAATTVVIDSEGMGNGVSARNTNLMSVEAGKINRSLSFDATNDYIDVAGINLKQYPIVIINIWTKAYGNESTTYTRVLSDETGGNIGNMILFRRPSEDRVIFVCNDGSVHTINIAGAFPKDVWIMWTLIRVNNQFIRLLKNGVQIGSDVSIGDASTVGATTLTFGAEQWDKGAKYNGEIDSTYIHAVSSILTPDEIAKIYNEGNGTEDHIPVVRRLPVGTNGQRLQADSSTPEGIKWVTP